MNAGRSFATRIFRIILFGLVALAITFLAGGIWTTLLVVNLQKSPTVPWSVPAMAVLLWLMWGYLGGNGWPRSTSAARRYYLRANRKSVETYLWSFVAGVLSVAALAGLWIVLFRLVRTPTNTLPDVSSYPRLTVALVIMMGSLVAPLMEEAAFRGYFQVALEREFRGVVAVAISSLVFALAHFVHGMYWPKLLVYFLVGVAFGATAYLAKSILPAIPPHIVGDLTFFTMVWPRDAARQLVSERGTDSWFWIHAAQTVVFAILAVWAFARLAKESGAAEPVGEPANQHA